MGFAGNITRTFEKGVAVIIGIISTFIFAQLRSKPNRTELSLVIILVFLLGAGADTLLRTWLFRLPVFSRNAVWKDTLSDLLDFLLLLGIFLVVQIVLGFFSDALNVNNPNFLEISVGVFILMLTGFAVVQSVKQASKPIETSPQQQSAVLVESESALATALSAREAQVSRPW